MKPVLLRSPDGVSGNGPVPAPPRVAGSVPSEPPPPKIQAFSQGLSSSRKGEESWKRQSTNNGTGASHVKSFHCKLSEESLAFLDQQINDWLDAHPQLEVKFVTSGIGEWQGKAKEPQMVVQLWL